MTEIGVSVMDMISAPTHFQPKCCKCINDICDFQIQDLSYSGSRTDDPC